MVPVGMSALALPLLKTLAAQLWPRIAPLGLGKAARDQLHGQDAGSPGFPGVAPGLSYHYLNRIERLVQLPVKLAEPHVDPARLNTYSHVLPETQRDAAAKLAALLETPEPEATSDGDDARTNEE
jgi:hypothetical protein